MTFASCWQRSWVAFGAVLAALLLAACDPVSLEATATPDALIHHVAPGGSDDNDGYTPASPLARIQTAVDRARAGDEIRLADGRYDQDVVTRRDGLAAAPIRITGPRTAVLHGAGGARVLEIRHDHIHVFGFTIDGLHGDAGSAAGYRDKLIYVQGAGTRKGVEGLVIIGMHLRNAGGECVRLRYFARGNEIAHNVIERCGVRDFRFAQGGKNGEGIYLGTAPGDLDDGKNPTADPDQSTFNWIHDNEIDTGGNDCIDLKEAADRNRVENNRCTGQQDPKSAGISVRSDGNLVRGNTIAETRGFAIRLGSSANSGQGNTVTGNILTNNDAGGLLIEAVPQERVCGNTYSGPADVATTGTHAAAFMPLSPCPP